MTSVIDMKVDHVTVAGQDLDKLERAFSDLGLTPRYGGSHSNGITHMSIISFKDGSYIELISSMEPDEESPLWDQHIKRNGGACAWAVYVDDIESEVERLVDLGVTVRGPYEYSRERPDGLELKWDLAYLGEDDPGAKLPFLIQDHTPREHRVGTETTADSLVGIGTVLLGIDDMDGSIELFRDVFNLSEPEREINKAFDAELARFEDAPVTLVTPSSQNSWLSERLHEFGESPCGYLIETENFGDAVEEFGISEVREWFDNEVGWFNFEGLSWTKIGLITSTSDFID